MKFFAIFLSLFYFQLTWSQNIQVQNKLDFEHTFNLEDYKGKTYLYVVKNVIKPVSDQVAKEGYSIAAPNFINSLFRATSAPRDSGSISDKVAWKAEKAAGGRQNLLKIAETLSTNGQKYNFVNLPNAIRSVSQGRVDIYDLSTFLGLASGGGTAVVINNKNAFYNVNYGAGFEERAVQTGRSFGLSPMRGADDASDAAYLKDLQEYIHQTQDPSPLYKTVLEMVMNCDAKGYAKLSPLGQLLATDFLAVYTAEQIRKLMDYQYKKQGDWYRSLNWDEALLEVTLLSAFHSGQSTINVMFNGIFTDKTLKQLPGGNRRDQFQPATLVDWWQFSTNPDPKHRNRSGINMTRRDFTKLGLLISEYEREKNPELVAKLEAMLGNQKREKNLFRQLSNYIINLKTPTSLGSKAYNLAEVYVQFLMQVKKDANAISAKIKKEQGDIQVKPIEPKTLPETDEESGGRGTQPFNRGYRVPQRMSA